MDAASPVKHILSSHPSFCRIVAGSTNFHSDRDSALVSETYGSSRRNAPSTRTPRHKARSKAPTQGRYISVIEEFTVTETLSYTRALY